MPFAELIRSSGSLPAATILAWGIATSSGSSALGPERSNRTVVGSTATTSSMMSRTGSAGDSVSGSSRRPNVATTSSDVKSLPSWNLTPDRSVKVHWVLSALGSHDSASCGASVPSGFRTARFSKSACAA